MRSKRLSFTTRYVLLFGILLFVTSGILGLVILDQSKVAMRELINKNMLDVVKSAAGTLDGDVLGALTEDDVDGPEFLDIKKRLTVFQNAVDIHYIYAVKQVDEDDYVFTVDPDPVNPGEFGEEIVTTPALKKAATGDAAVDKDPVADEWGNYYSAFCPVFDSSGKVAGVVGVDFDADWCDQQVQRHTVSIAVITSISVFFGGAVIAIITGRVRAKFRDLDEGLSELSNNVDYLMDEMASYSGYEAPKTREENDSAGGEDELEKLGSKIHTMQTEMSMYLDYLHSQAYTDSLTRVENSTAYHEAIDELNEKINEGSADFWIAVFDVNSLKEINDTFGHEYGDRYIIATARVIEAGLEGARTFRIGGDEFAVIAESYDEARMEEGLSRVDDELKKFNETEKPCSMSLFLSKGTSRFQAGKDTSYSDVFARADRIMYDNKREYYQTVGNRRGRDRTPRSSDDA